jgi:hypothetical protein
MAQTNGGAGETTPQPFELTDTDLELVDAIVVAMDQTLGRQHTRTDAIRWALQLLAVGVKTGMLVAPAGNGPKRKDGKRTGKK